MRDSVHKGSIVEFEPYLEKFCELKAPVYHGSSPIEIRNVLMFILEYGRTVPILIVKELLQNLEDKSLVNEDGLTPIHFAVAYGDIEMVKYLLTILKDRFSQSWSLVFGMETAINGYHSETPLHFATKIGRLDMIHVLCNAVLHKNPADNYGSTPLHIAAEKGFIDIYKYLVHIEQNKNPMNKVGQTPLHLATYKS